jgi:uncharacterized membrane protein YphA (DoxX/SURF4 family)
MNTGSRSSGAPAAALLLIQIAIGYEWFTSGLTKVAHGDFAAGLGADLAERAKQAPGWYRGFLDSAAIPHASALGYAIEIAELLAGVTLIGAAVVLLVAGGRASSKLRRRCLLAIASAAFAGLVMAVNFKLANGGGFGRPVAGDSFDEGIDLDTMMVGLQLILLGFSLVALRRPRTHPSRLKARLAQAYLLLR